MKDTEINHDVLDHQLEVIKEFLDMEGVTEVWINQPQKLIYKKYTSADPVVVDMPQLTYQFLKQLAKTIANYNSRKITEENPILTGSLPEGQRVQVVMPPAVEKNTISFSIRIPSPVNKSLDELEAEGAFSECKPATNELEPFEHDLVKFNKEGRIKEFIELAVRSRRNIIIAGETGSGKTTIAKSMIQSIPRNERLITLESDTEIDLKDFPNKVHMLYSREDNGKTFISPKQCLQACLRMNPSRILMAEILGDEAWDYLKSINTGHAGSITTMHANGALAAFEQFTALVKESPRGANLDHKYIKSRLISTVDVIFFYSNMKLVNIYYEPTRKHEYLD
jgi:type IV secretion system protein VirB11